MICKILFFKSDNIVFAFNNLHLVEQESAKIFTGANYLQNCLETSFVMVSGTTSDMILNQNT